MLPFHHRVKPVWTMYTTRGASASRVCYVSSNGLLLHVGRQVIACVICVYKGSIDNGDRFKDVLQTFAGIRGPRSAQNGRQMPVGRAYLKSWLSLSDMPASRTMSTCGLESERVSRERGSETCLNVQPVTGVIGLQTLDLLYGPGKPHCQVQHWYG